MWSSVVVLALPIALDPVRLGVNLLLVSRPRPAQNLLVYWVGCVLASVVLLLVPILVLHFTPTFSSFVHDLANPATTASSTVRHAEIVMGVFVLAVAALLAVRVWARRRTPAPAGAAVTSAPAAEDDANEPDLTAAEPRQRRRQRRRDPASGVCSAAPRMRGKAGPYGSRS